VRANVDTTCLVVLKSDYLRVLKVKEEGVGLGGADLRRTWTRRRTD
jgi:hypothetical protein